MQEGDILGIVENNSTDGTKDFIKGLGNSVVHIERDLDDPPTFPPIAIKERADFLASMRQECIDWVIDFYNSPEYFIMFDSDLANIPTRGWDSMFTDHAAVASQGLDVWTQDGKNVQAVYYDSWTHQELDTDKLRYGQDNYPPFPPEGLKEVRSAFGGVGVYRWDAIKDCKYHWLETPGATEDPRYINSGLCEHAGLHADIRKRGGKVFLNTEYYPIRNAVGVKIDRSN